ncbi:MAG: cytochrome P450 [Okeania sp. SIO2G4]|uniref:cytochrome P450 n=1 Tax=unclassified Okeania TaxID=2634635 RepID=UPI0013BE8977|nr:MULTISPECIES: cytochrome P450 [unclassified Okeania]NEP04337.1 cytochrome P450 [Okeania sp. SIO4D6]NEP72571.1 cytochrome P450 [Okeania sp. SIO2G5]NEP95390.1 cytochrome P450 [Okeania sp. SIO2F5]NEQ92967.1 cytochrome P450 [Okeania sp. SIO2G4]
MTQLLGPKAPALIQLLHWVAKPLTFMEKCAKEYGDAFQVKLNYPMVFISHPKAIEEILKTNPKQFDSGMGNLFLLPLLGDSSLALLDGTLHQRQRQLLMPPFHGERMQAYGELICAIAEKVASKWVVGQPFSMRESTQEISLKVILQAVFGLEEGQRYDKLEQLLTLALESLASPSKASMLFFKFLQVDLGKWSPWGKFLRQRQEVDELLYAEIAERRQQLDSERSDILTMLLLARDEAGEPMSDRELRDELMTLLFAGHETTATALAWAFYWIHRQPEIYNKLLSELEDLGDNPDPMAVIKLPYLNAVCSETLRIYPVAITAFSRIAKSPITIMGQTYPEGTALSPCIYLTHHREDLYPEPEKFKPERFLERQYSAYEFLPFGGSSRRCIGAAFAMFEMKLVLATILKRYSLALAEKKTVKAVRRGVTLAPAGGVKMVMTRKCMSQTQQSPSVAAV